MSQASTGFTINLLYGDASSPAVYEEIVFNTYLTTQKYSASVSITNSNAYTLQLIYSGLVGITSVIDNLALYYLN